MPRVAPRKSSDQGRLGDHPLVVDLAVGGDHAGDVAAPSSSSSAPEAEPELGQLGDVGVVVGDLGAELAQQVGDLQRRRLAHVADARLVGDAEQQHARAADRLADVVERPADALDAVVRLLLVDLAGELDELGREVVLARLEGEVERVDRQAVAAHPGARARSA